MTTTAIIPLKALTAAKGRLATVLSGEERQELVAWMARRVVLACRRCSSIDDVLVVAGDHAGAAVGRGSGARALVIGRPGLDAALAVADAATRDSAATVIVAADLPALTSQDLDALFTAADGCSGPVVVVAPTDDGGTGALLRRPPAAIKPAYGPGSAAAHQRLAREAGITPLMVHRPGLAFDLDHPGQLPAALALTADHDVPCRPR